MILKGREIESLPLIPIWQYVKDKIQAFGDKVAQVEVETKREITYTEIINNSKYLSDGLKAQGIKRGDVVAICSENNLDYCWIVLGVLQAGACCALLSPTYTSREWDHALSISQPSLVMCSNLVCETKIDQYLETGTVKQVFVWGAGDKQLPKYCMSLEETLLNNKQTKVVLVQNNNFVSNISDQAERTNEGSTKELPAFILSSSGSTGLPKGVVLTHFNVTTALTTSGDYTSSDEIALGISPFCHAYGLLLVFMCMCEGSRVVIMRKFSPHLFIKSIQEFKITCLHLVASLLVFLLKRDVLDKPECKSVHHIWTGAAPLSPKLQILALEKLSERAVLHHSYGLTETTFTMFTCVVGFSSLGTPGKLTPGMECKVIDVETGKLIGPNCRGELCFRGPLLMKEYMRNEEATVKAIDSDGWLHSGDLGYYNDNGYFFIVDRLKEIIKYQGYQVSPSELESILIMHPAVMDAAVVGIEDETFGELPRAFIVKESDSSVTADEIKSYIADQVSPYKKLSGGVCFVSFIPKTTTGKINRRELRTYIDNI